MRRAVTVISLIVLVVAAAAYSRLPVRREAAVFDVSPPTPYFHYSAQSPSRGRVLLVHGLNANKRMLNLISYSLAESGLDVFTIDLPGHGESRTPFNALMARQAVAQVLERLGPDTQVLGHSLGGALLLDVVSDHPVKSMVLFSPAPAPIDHLLASRVLVFEGQFDPGRIRVFAPEIEAASQGAFEYHDLPWTGHTGGLTKPWVIARVAEWFGGDSALIRARQRLLLSLVMIVSSLILGLALLPQRKKIEFSIASNATPSRNVVTYVVATSLAAIAAVGVPVGRVLHLFVTDYLLAVFLLTGILLCASQFRRPVLKRSLYIAIAAAAFMIVVPGVLVISEFTQLMLSNGRWWRFPAIACFSLPWFWADEIAIRPIASHWKSTLTGVTTRILFAAIVATTAMTFHREAAFLVMLLPALLIFWVALWFAGDLLYRRLRDPFAVAVFLSLVQGWVFASLFITT